MMFISDIMFYLSPKAIADGSKIALVAGEYKVIKGPTTTIQAVNGGVPPTDQSAEVAALTQQVADLTQALADCQAGNPSPVQTIDSFTATPNPVVAGQPTTLAWATTGGNSATLDGVPVAVSGSQVVTPAANKTYTLAVNAAPVTKTLDVVVTPGQPAPTITGIAANPTSLPVGGGDTNVTATVGGGPVNALTWELKVGNGPSVPKGAAVLPLVVPLT